MLLVTRSASIIPIQRDIISSLRNFSKNLSPADSDWTGVTDTFRAIEKSSLIARTPALSVCIRKRMFPSAKLVNPSKSLHFYFHLNLISRYSIVSKSSSIDIELSYPISYLRFKDDIKKSVDITHLPPKEIIYLNIHKYRKNTKSTFYTNIIRKEISLLTFLKFPKILSLSTYNPFLLPTS